MILDVRARVLAAEELLASKLFVVRRERFDGADIAHIIFASRGTLNWERVLVLVGEHWEILLLRPGAVSLCLPCVQSIRSTVGMAALAGSFLQRADQSKSVRKVSG